MVPHSSISTMTAKVMEPARLGDQTRGDEVFWAMSYQAIDRFAFTPDVAAHARLGRL